MFFVYINVTGTVEDVDDMCNEDARKNTTTSGVEGSRSEDSNVR